MADQNTLQKLFHQTGCRDFRWIEPKHIVVAHWVRMKCTFGCESFGRNAACPPNTPSLPECRDFFREYRLGAMFRFHNGSREAEEVQRWVRLVNSHLLDLEREVVAAGCPMSFLLFLDSCNFCRDCAKQRHNCRNRRLSRPSPQGMGVDIAATAGRFGFSPAAAGEVGTEQYALLLLE